MIDIVTGASGFIGKHLMKRIGAGALTIPHDAIHETHFPDCDRFFFLSTYGNMSDHTDRGEILRANIGHLGYVLGSYIEESRCDHFIFVSSSSVELSVLTPYAHAKLAAEEMVKASGIPYTIVRPFSVTGVGEQPEHLIPTLIRSCMEGELMQFVPEPTHNFVDVEDVVDAILFLAERKATGTYGIGDGFAASNQEIKNAIEVICGKRARLRFVDNLRSYDSLEWDNRDTKLAGLGWTPKKEILKSLQEMVDAYKFRRKQK